MKCTHKYTLCDCPDPLGWRILEWGVMHVAPWLLIAAMELLVVYALELVLALVLA